MSSPLLEARGLTRSFGPRVVLRGLDLVLAPGETLAIVGPNGAGKTTLLRVLAGLVRPSGGEVLLDGRRLTPAEPSSRAAVGLLSHRSLLYDDLTVLENLVFAARLMGVAAPVEAARRALAEVDLAARAGDSPRTLSRGLLQRAALARALIHAPRLLLLDEPFTGLDAVASERLQRLLRERRPAGLGTVVVTHQVAEVWDFADRVHALVGGRWALQDREGPQLDDFLRRYREVVPA
ncbi:MAG: heme ABC exporter ATP-binding protein CcmA [Gemmatimonadales bacterium]|nr:heme ABC exporter ATP-binding protein CcmA [Gemmatimonadales bacterium]